MSSFTSLDELPREMGDRFSVAWQFTPSSSFDDHAMELNERHTALTLRAYGFGGLVVQSYFGENTTYGVDGVSVTDLNPDGSAAGSATASEARAALAAASVHYGGDTMQTNTQWPIATVRINRTELADRVASQVQTGANERRAQTHGLDAALRAGLRKAALQKARSDFLGFIPVEIISAYFSAQEIAAILTHDASTLALLVSGMQLGSLIVTAAGQRMRGAAKPLKDKRFSFFPANVQPDRLLLGAALTSMRFIRYNRGKEQPAQ